MKACDWSRIPLTNKKITPQARRINTDKAQIYFVPNFLSSEICNQIIKVINFGLVPSEISTGTSNLRTSKTCHLPEIAPNLSDALDVHLSKLTGIKKEYAESIQGQRYDPGEYYKAHYDWFDPECESYEECCEGGGQRTWTAMIYLNEVEEGGETDFSYLELTVKPIAGLALIWNNLNPDNTTNEFTLHEALPVLSGSKYVITKWYREQPGCSLV